MTTVDEAYRVCEAVTRAEARNFFYGIRLLPVPKRYALCALYALSRRIDDVGDGNLPTPEKRQALAEVRASLRTIESSVDPVLFAVADAARRYPIPLEAFAELVDGVEMDLDARRYDTFEDLVEYCRCVAGSVGRMCLAVFGSVPHPHAPAYADALGIALQQTNILRDVREDFLHGRVYLPQKDLYEYGVELRLDVHGGLSGMDGDLAGLIRVNASRARGWYARGQRLMPLLDRRSAACARAMSGIYRQLLDRVSDDPSAVSRGRLSLPAWRKAGVAARALLGVGS